MQIPEIKQQLSLIAVVQHYGHPPTRHHLLRCPFHEDQTASLQIYPKTNTWHCFGCGKGTDTIDFIKYKENCSTHEAILKAQLFLNNNLNSKPMETTAITITPIPEIKRIQGLSTAFQHFTQSLKATAKAQEYLQGRAIDYRKIIAGYDSHHFHKEKEVTPELQQLYLDLGLIYPDKHGRKENYRSRFDGCIVFPTFDEQSNIVSMYGRKIETAEGEGGHYKLPGEHRGLYPKYPDAHTEILLITECIIDAVTLLQHPFITEKYTLLSLYGAKIWTKEHSKAIRNLPQLKEVIFALDGDKEGREGTEKHAETIKQIHPQIKISYLNIPDNEDINSLAQGHAPEIFTQLIHNRKLILNPSHFFLSPRLEQDRQEKQEMQPTWNGVPQENGKEKSAENPVKEKINIIEKLPSSNGQPLPQHPEQNPLNTKNPYKLRYSSPTANYYIQGGIGKALDSMRVTLVIEHKETQQKSRNKVDLYEDKQVEKTARDVSEKLQLRSDLLEADIYKLTDLLEEYREKEILQNEENTEVTARYTISKEEEKKLLDFLKKQNLLYNISELLGKSGIVGEEKNRIFLFAIAISHICNETLHVLIQGSSGSGKTRLSRQISDCMPAEKVVRLTRISDKSLYNYPERYLCNKLMSLEDADGLSEEAEFAWRELVSNGELISSISVKDESGRISTVQKTVRGPIASMSCTTNGSTYEDNISRMFVVAVDESKEQTQKVIAYQNAKSAGKIDTVKEQKIKYFLQKIVRMLKPLPVINPFADKVLLPEEAHKLRRLNDLFKIFIHQMTLIHQYQREKDEQGRLISTKEDVKIAVEILFNSIVLKVDELDGSLRQFYEKLKEQVKKIAKENIQNYTFTQREIRQALHISKTQLQRFLYELTELEYIQPSGGYRNHGFRYKIMFWDDYKVLRERIKKHLYEQIDRI